MQKKILISILIVILISFLIIIIYPVVKNNNYQKELISNIEKNTNIDDITYVNKDNNYYIVRTNKQVTVLDLNYDEVFNISSDLLIDSKLELTYARNNLYYKEKVREGSKLSYNYYDVTNNEKVYSSLLGGYYE